MTLAHRYRFEAIGTRWSIDTPEPLSQKLTHTIEAYIEQFDVAFSRFRSDSTVMQARRAPGIYHFPADSGGLFELYEQLYGITGGAVNPLIGESLEALGYDASYSLVQTNTIAAPSYNEAVSRTGTTITFHTPCLLDIGAVGKGFLVDRIAEYVATEHDQYIIDGSGDMTVHTDQPERIGLEDPSDSTRAIGEVRLSNKALCASATNRRSWGGGNHHVIDARTGKSVNGVLATWVVANTAMLADGLASALFYISPERLNALYPTIQIVAMYSDGRVYQNLDPDGELY